MKKLSNQPIPCEDHLGNKYSSITKMYQAYGLGPNTFYSRKRYGWDLEKILTTPAIKCTPCEDHLGNKYESLTEMCQAYDISLPLCCKRLERGWDIEKILTTPARKRSR